MEKVNLTPAIYPHPLFPPNIAIGLLQHEVIDRRIPWAEIMFTMVRVSKDPIMQR